MRRPLDKIKLTPERKTHYSNLHAWLKLHPEIKFKKLAVGFSIDTSTISPDLVEEFLRVCTYSGG